MILSHLITAVNTIAITAAQTPVPRDLQLPLPLNSWELEVALVALFLLHIVFVNLMVGGSILSVFFEILGLTWPKYDALAKRIAYTITVNKSLAVVLGVGPLLCISLLYTMQFYAANALTGHAWIAVVPLVSLAFLLAYLHKYTWDKWTGPFKNYHIAIGASATFLFLCIPFIFLANINLMLFPAKWVEINGFFSSLEVGNVFPRFFHFLSASLAFTGLFLAGWFGRKSFPIDTLLPEFTRAELRRLFYRFAFFLTIAQLAFGPLLFVTLPSGGLTLNLLLVITGGILAAVFVLTLLWREIRSEDSVIGRYYALIWVVFGCVVAFMGTGRHLYREACVEPHRQAIAERTESFLSVQESVQMRLAAGLGAGEALESGPTGKSVFRNCAACHAVDKVLAAPSLREVYSIYKGNPDGIVTWARNPGKKRPEFAPMPAFAHLGDEQLHLVADYILQIAAPETTPDTEPES